jgi:hypothetical protein
MSQTRSPISASPQTTKDPASEYDMTEEGVWKERIEQVVGRERTSSRDSVVG